MTRAFAWITVAYITAIAAAVAVIQAVAWGPLWAAFWADLVATVVVFAFSIGFRNSSFYDAYWSVAPPLLVGYWWWTGDGGTLLRLVLVSVLVGVWAVRLTANWAHGWRGLTHADWRYERLSQQLGGWYWPVSLLGVHLVPTLVVFAGCLPLYVVANNVSPLGLMDVIGTVVGCAAVWLETRADLELHKFRQLRTGPAEVLSSGVWSWCRHPNYLGEIGVWVALGCFALGAAWELWPLVGVAAMVVLFLGISIPMIERKLAEDKPGFADYRARVPMLLPWGRLRAFFRDSVRPE